MKWLPIIIISLNSLLSCAQKENSDLAIPLGVTKSQAKNEAVATFAEGCFWHSELVFQSLKGVRDAVSGYAGGSNKHPNYQLVGTGQTGHAESVQVYYDPSIISYETLVAAFFASQNPTTPNRQGPDVGTEYRSIAFYRNEKEKQIIEKEMDRINASKKFKNKIVTEVVPFKAFYPAEDYHQEYIYYHRDNPYVQNVSIPDYLRFRKEFPKGNFKN